VQQLSAQDAQFLYMETHKNLGSVTAINIYDPSTAPGGMVRFKDILAHVESRIPTSPLYTRRLERVPFELDYPYWVEDKYFDLEYHIRHGRLPEPGDWRQFCIHMARYHSRPLDMMRPPWEMYVLEGLDRIEMFPPGAYAIATKVHHAAVDGMAAVKFFSGMSDLDAKGTPVIRFKPAPKAKPKEPHMTEMLVRAWFNNIRAPLRMTDSLIRSAPKMALAAQRSVATPKSKRTSVPRTRFNQEVSPHKMFDAAIFKLQDFKTIRKGVEGCTINDVVLAVCSGGLRRYLMHHDELPGKSLVAWVPINARPKGPVKKGIENSSNNITAMTTELHTQIEDPIERLNAIRNSTLQSKEAKSGISARMMTDLSQHVSAATQVVAARLVLSAGLAARMCNLFISNVPGPQIPLYMNGAKGVYNFGMAPLTGGMGLFIATPSYNGTISFGVTSTREILPDIRFFIECLEASLAELLKAVAREAEADKAAEKSKPARKKAPKKKAAKKTPPKKAAKKAPRKKTTAKKVAEPSQKP
jgi:WS/DGAT/MGAT family acyltransferase